MPQLIPLPLPLQKVQNIFIPLFEILLYVVGVLSQIKACYWTLTFTLQHRSVVL